MIFHDAGVEAARRAEQPASLSPESPSIGDVDLILEVGQATDPGVARRENEDALGFECPRDPILRHERGSLFVVCDGIGGMVAGDYASKQAVRAFIGHYYAAPQSSWDQMLRYAAEAANRDLGERRRSRPGMLPMGTTLVAALITGRQLWVLNIGDSRAYIWRQAALHQISRDHTPDSHRRPRDRRISRALGTDPTVIADVFGPLPLAPGDRVLLCTDGLTTVVSGAHITRILGEFTPAEAARQLIEQAKTSGTQDNTTVITVGVLEESPPAPEVGPAARGEMWLTLIQRWLSRETWEEINPVGLIQERGWHTRRGAMILAGWLVGALLLGVLLGWLLLR